MKTSKMRPDGRLNAGTLRPLCCELSPLQRSDGSAVWKSGSTQVLAAVYGPIAPQKTSLEKRSALLSIIYTSTTKGNNNSNESMLLEKILEGCICTEQYGRCVIEIVIQTIQNDGSLLSCALHAAVAALMDAGISMNNLPVATTVMVTTTASEEHTDNNFPMILDPDLEEEQQENSSIVTLISSNTNPDHLLGSNTDGSGSLSLKQILGCQEAASKATTAVITFMRMAIEQKLIRQSKTLLPTPN
mmetsp:Transcript_16503/g.19023  ORF Transcript_16503/g.19023 Transcript_16503/m.19023 type:complete len:245 (-) Transcript_16503:95-829(-)